MSVIDTHCHMWRYGVDFSEAYAVRLASTLSEYPRWREITRTGRKEDLTVTYEDCVRDMNRNGIDKSVILGSAHYHPSSPEIGWVEIKNDYIAEAQNKYPDRLIGFASIDPRGWDRAVREIDRAILDLGLKGIGELGVIDAGLALDDPTLDPIYRRCEELARERGMSLDIHTGFHWCTWGHMEKQDPALLWHVLEKFPELKIKVDHAGYGGTWDHALHLAVAWPNVYLDFTFLRTIYPPFKIMQFLQHAKWVGILNRCLWGTDYPWLDPKDDLDMYRKFPAESNKLGIEPVLTDEDIQDFLGGNAKKYLGLK